MKRRTWRRWPREEPATPGQRYVKRRGKADKRATPTRCPVCDTPLAGDYRTQDGAPVLVLRCPNPDCPRNREIRDDTLR